MPTHPWKPQLQGLAIGFSIALAIAIAIAAWPKPIQSVDKPCAYMARMCQGFKSGKPATNEPVGKFIWAVRDCLGERGLR